MRFVDLVEAANRYLEEEISLNDLASEYGVSKTTLIRYFGGEYPIKLPIDLQQKINERRKQRFIESKSTKGNEGHYVLDDKRVIYIAKYYVNNECTLDDLSVMFKVNKATIYNSFTENRLGKDLYKMVTNKYNNRKLYVDDKGKFTKK